MGVQPGVPILAAILVYFDSGFSLSFNANKRGTKEALQSALGADAPKTLKDLGLVVENIVKYGMRNDAVDQAHVAGIWRLLYLMFRSDVSGATLLPALLRHAKQWMEGT